MIFSATCIKLPTLDNGLGSRRVVCFAFLGNECVQETVKEVQVTLMDIFFDFDKANLKDDQKQALQADLAALQTDPKLKLLIEGHCDERGTAEYNLALGERRAKAVKDALQAAGISADRISIISYGKERPFVLGPSRTK